LLCQNARGRLFRASVVIKAQIIGGVRTPVFESPRRATCGNIPSHSRGRSLTGLAGHATEGGLVLNENERPASAPAGQGECFVKLIAVRRAATEGE
jgi:hypothetical protein